MGKARAKDFKPKRQPAADFKKKTAKVGRKVQSSNVTNIKVASKRIQVPLQAQITDEKPENEKETLKTLLRSLQHHNEPARIAALEDLMVLLKSSKNTESYICLVFPPALELLFDDERNTRKTLLVLISTLLPRYPSSSFLSIVPVIITYVCSGLTSLNKSIRRDSLTLLLALAHNHAQLLIPYLERLIEHVLALLLDPSQSTGQDSLGSNAKAGAVMISSGGAVSKAKANFKAEAGRGKREVTVSAGGSEPDVRAVGRPPLLIAVLEVLEAVLTCAAGAATQNDTHNAQHSRDASQVVLLRPIRRSCLFLDKSRGLVSIANSSSADAGGAAERGLGLSHSIISSLCRRLSLIWRGLVLDSSLVASHSVRVLSLIARVAGCLGASFGASGAGEFVTLVAALFDRFPHTSMEAAKAVSGSASERSSTLGVTVMNLAICDVAILHCDPSVAVGDQVLVALQKAETFLMQQLNKYMDTTLLHLLSSGKESDAEGMAVDEDDDDDDEEDEEEEDGDDDGKVSARAAAKNNAFISEKLFRALELLKLSQYGDSGGVVGVNTLLGALGRIVQALSASAVANAEAVARSGHGMVSAKTLTAVATPVLTCLFRVTSDATLWKDGYADSSLALLVDALGQISPLAYSLSLSDPPTKTGGPRPSSAFVSIVGDSFATALLSVARRLPVGAPSAVQLALARCVMELFERPTPTATTTVTSIATASAAAITNGGPTDEPHVESRAKKTPSYYQRSPLSTRYLLLDVFAHVQFSVDAETPGGGLTLAGAMKSAMADLSHASVGLDEQSYLMRIAYGR